MRIAYIFHEDEIPCKEQLLVTIGLLSYRIYESFLALFQEFFQRVCVCVGEGQGKFIFMLIFLLFRAKLWGGGGGGGQTVYMAGEFILLTNPT